MTFSKKDTQMLKGIAIIFMLIHHLFLDPSRYKGYSIDFWPLTENLTTHIALAMKLCVALFVMLSAYGMTISYKKINNNLEIHRKQIKKTITSRYIKMMSGFMLIFLLVQIYALATNQPANVMTIYGKGIVAVFYFILDLFGLAQLFHTPTFISTFWYMSLAQIIIFVLPVMIWIYKQFGSSVLLALSMLIAVLFPVPTANASYEKTYAFFTVYVVCIALGIIMADKDLIVKMRNINLVRKWKVLSKIIKFVFYVTIIVALLVVREDTRLTPLIAFWDAILPMLIIGFSFEYINVIPGIKHVLGFLGTYSMEIFLLHNIIGRVWYKDFFYGIGKAWEIFGLLLFTTLIVAVAINLFEKLIRFHIFTNWLIAKATKEEK